MSRSSALCVILVVLTVVQSVPRKPYDLRSTVLVDINPEVENPFHLENPSIWTNIFENIYGSEKKDTSNVKDLFMSSQLTAVPSVNAEVENVLHYTIGKRLPNDRIVSHGIDFGNWSTPSNVTLTLKYPANGQGAKVTFAEFFVKQTSKIGAATVKDGGIGQRSITINLEAKNVLSFTYKGVIYGI